LSEILVAEPQDFSGEARRILEDVARVRLEQCTREQLGAAFGAYDAVWFRLAHRVDAALLGAHPRCRILATPVTGLDHIDLAACEARGVRVISLRGETEFLRDVRATAELAVTLVLALIRRIPQAAESVRRGEWRRDLFRGGELHGKTAGIVGVGRLGRIVADYLRAFGMRVIGVDPRPDFPRDVERADSLEALLPVCDVVSLHVSYDGSTRGLIGVRELNLMKTSAVLVNTSRGGVIDEAALLAALESGRLAGAALDVVEGEPDVRPEHPVLRAAARLENLLVVPHIGGNTRESFAKTEVFLARKVAEALR
jgi:D-3-phosphoglycerate dehydrogenase / 2-oxoglutarate reductase